MSFASFFFDVFSLVLLGSASMVVTSRNPVHSVLFLILAFFNAAALFLIAGAEFLAMILVIVYVGAVAVLFLFVVMMLDVNFTELRSRFQSYWAVGATVGGILLLELLGVFLVGWDFSPGSKIVRLSTIPANVQNTRAIGQVLYTDYVFLFQLSGLILLVAMIGAIVLTHRDRSVAKRQNITRQQSRLVGDTLEILTPRIGAGVQELGIYRPKPEPEPAHRALPAPHEHAHEDH